MDVDTTLDKLLDRAVDLFPDSAKFLEEIPKTATGTFDEQRLRSEFEHVRPEEADKKRPVRRRTGVKPPWPLRSLWLHRRPRRRA